MDETPFDRLDGLRVLIVDDVALNLVVARGILEALGARVATAAGGLQALEHLRSRAQETDVVLMDVQMPGMDGLETVRRIRDELGLPVPVLGLSAGVSAEEQERCLGAGMAGFVGKPFQKKQLLSLLGPFLPCR